MAHAGIDWSNYQGQMTPQYAAGLARLGVWRVAAQTEFASISEHCAAACVSAGLGLDAVRYLYADQDAGDQARQALDEVAKAKANYGAFTRYLWLDFEDPFSTFDQLQQAIDVVNASGPLLSAGIYASPESWRVAGDSHDFASLPLRIAKWNGLAALPLAGFGGWERANAIQYSQGVTVLGVNVNPNLFDDTDLGG